MLCLMGNSCVLEPIVEQVDHLITGGRRPRPVEDSHLHPRVPQHPRDESGK